MTEELETLKLFVEKLDEGNFIYYLTGSMAMSFYTVPRMTRDSDIVILLNGKDVDRFVKLFKGEFFVDKNMIKDSLKSHMIFTVFHKKNFFKIDFILKTSDKYEEVKFERSNILKINGLEVNVISIEDLIVTKVFWDKDRQSEKHFNDIRDLMKMSYDEKYVSDWIAKLCLRELFTKGKS